MKIGKRENVGAVFSFYAKLPYRNRMQSERNCQMSNDSHLALKLHSQNRRKFARKAIDLSRYWYHLQQPTPSTTEVHFLFFGVKLHVKQRRVSPSFCQQFLQLILFLRWIFINEFSSTHQASSSKHVISLHHCAINSICWVNRILPACPRK